MGVVKVTNLYQDIGNWTASQVGGPPGTHDGGNLRALPEAAAYASAFPIKMTASGVFPTFTARLQS
jgi:hypothetical protein